MKFPVLAILLGLYHLISVAYSHSEGSHMKYQMDREIHYGNDSDPVAYSVRAHWMQRAKQALVDLTGLPCPFGAFGAVIVNHTNRAHDELGDLICIGANSVAQVGNPTLHGEVAAINNCTKVLAAAPYHLDAAEILTAWADLSLYTTAEACPMCAAAIAWGNFREYIYATRAQTLVDMGWTQFTIDSREVLARSPAADRIRIVGGVLEDETDELFQWQFQAGACPKGCSRDPVGGCSPNIV